MIGGIALIFVIFYINTVNATYKEDKSKPPPHILFVLIDDLGWGDVGFHSSNASRELQTPVMDRLATIEGLQLNRHYVHCSCTGTRTSLQSGRFPVHVQTSLKNPEDPSSGMPRNLTSLAEHLKKQNANYATHYVGKWDVGMASPKHTPRGRGYDTSLNYFEHKNDYWTQACLQSACCRQYLNEEEQSAQSVHDATDTIFDLWDTDHPAKTIVGTDYEEFIFQRRMLDIIDNHAANHTQSAAVSAAAATTTKPLFLFYAPHVAHCPLQVPRSYLDQFDFMDDDEGMCQGKTFDIVGPNRTDPPYSCRKQYHAMIKLLDDILGSLVDRLKEHGLWENTLMVVTSDNGGPIDPKESGATNYPLRGGKYSDWEGGVRATAFVSGGYLPKERRGTIVREAIHIADWYATLPALAGIDVGQEESVYTDDQRVPPVDAVNVWPLIVGSSDNKKDSTERTRNEIPLSKHALIVGEYKLIWNDEAQVNRAGWTYPNYPNAHTLPDEIDNQTIDCSTGCLFNVETDPGEHEDIASLDPFRLQQMKKRLQELRKGFFENDDRGVDSCPSGYNDDDKSLMCACWMAVNYYGGFLGPYQEVELLAEKAAVKE